jgi:hypothetical protein
MFRVSIKDIKLVYLDDIDTSRRRSWAILKPKRPSRSVDFRLDERYIPFLAKLIPAIIPKFPSLQLHKFLPYLMRLQAQKG